MTTSNKSPKGYYDAQGNLLTGVLSMVQDPVNKTMLLYIDDTQVHRVVDLH